jgi:hypothetical protein
VLVQDQLGEFVGSVLRMSGWEAGQNLVLDGLRHAEVFRELQNQVRESSNLRVVHVARRHITRSCVVSPSGS